MELAQGPLRTSDGCCNYVENILRKLKKKSLNLIIYGLNEYFRYGYIFLNFYLCLSGLEVYFQFSRLQSLKDKQRFRAQCTGKTNSKGATAQDEDNAGLTPAQMDELKVRFTLQTECSIWPVETTEELGKTIARFSKAVAERPFK